MPIATRTVVVTRTWPYCHLKFIDTATENGVEWAHDNPEGLITLSIENDDYLPRIQATITEATRLWVNGADFIAIFRKYPDAIQNFSAT